MLGPFPKSLAVLVAGVSLANAAVVAGVGTAQFRDGTNIRAVLRLDSAEALKFSNVGLGAITGGQVQHGVCINLDALTYSGYDLTVEPIGPDRYRLTVRSLSLPLEKFDEHYADKRYQERPLPAIPAPGIVGERQPFAIPIGDGCSAEGRTNISIELSRTPFGTPWQRLLHWLGFTIFAG